MARTKVKLGAVSLGGWAQMVASSMKYCGNAEMYACYTRNEEKRNAFAEQYGCIPKASYEELLADPELDAVLLLSPNQVHLEQAKAAARAGKHVFVDKPITNTLKEAFALYRYCKKTRRVLAVGHNSRRLWTVRKLKAMIDNGELGDINMVEANFSHNGGLALRPGDWRYYHASCPSGPLIQLGIHNIDTFHYLFGPITEVAAIFNRQLVTAQIDDSTALVCKFKSGIIGYNGSGYTCKPAHKVLNVYGTKANAFLDPGMLEIRTEPIPKVVKKRIIKAPTTTGTTRHAIAEEISEFASAVRGQGAVEVSGKEAIEALAVVEAAIISNKTGRTVSVPKLLRKFGEF